MGPRVNDADIADRIQAEVLSRMETNDLVLPRKLKYLTTYSKERVSERLA